MGSYNGEARSCDGETLMSCVLVYYYSNPLGGGTLSWRTHKFHTTRPLALLRRIMYTPLTTTSTPHDTLLLHDVPHDYYYH